MWSNPQFPADLVTFTEENLNGKIWSFVQWLWPYLGFDDSQSRFMISLVIRGDFFGEIEELFEKLIYSGNLCLKATALKYFIWN